MAGSHRLRVLLMFCCLILAPGHARTAEPLTIYAASSLTESLQEIGEQWAATGAPMPRLSFAASSLLARQIEAGARADIFISADEDWMDYLQARDLLVTGTRRTLVGNRLVLVAPAGTGVRLNITRDFPIAEALGGGRLALADPDLVPAGRYARSALRSLGVWDAVAGRIVRAENVRVALAYVARGEAPLGIVYATDARIEPRAEILDSFPEDSHLPIRYPVALLKGAAPGARELLDHLSGPAARETFKRAGFILPTIEDPDG